MRGADTEGAGASPARGAPEDAPRDGPAAPGMGNGLAPRNSKGAGAASGAADDGGGPMGDGESTSIPSDEGEMAMPSSDMAADVTERGGVANKDMAADADGPASPDDGPPTASIRRLAAMPPPPSDEEEELYPSGAVTTARRRRRKPLLPGWSRMFMAGGRQWSSGARTTRPSGGGNRARGGQPASGGRLPAARAPCSGGRRRAARQCRARPVRQRAARRRGYQMRQRG